MSYHQIEVDSEVLAFLKAHAEPFVDTPNTVLRKILLGNKPRSQPSVSEFAKDIPDFPSSIPKSLEQTLQVIYLVRVVGRTRTEATNLVAQRHDVAVPTIIDKYGRQLGKKAFEIDKLLDEEMLNGFELLLKRHHAQHKEVITEFFHKLRDGAA